MDRCGTIVRLNLTLEAEQVALGEAGIVANVIGASKRGDLVKDSGWGVEMMNFHVSSERRPRRLQAGVETSEICISERKLV